MFVGPYTLKQGDHEWPFEFTIPPNCEEDASQVFHDKKSSIFDDDPQQDLPPSVEQVVSKNFNTSGNAFSITYPLTASVLVDKIIGSKRDDTSINLNIRLLRDVEHPSWRTVSQICKFQTFIDESGQLPKRKASIFRRRDSTQLEPNFNFALNAKIATTVIVGKPIPVFLALQHDTPPNANAPQFIITSISAILSTDNVTRSQGSQQELYLSGSPETLWNETSAFGSKLAMPIPIENGDALDVRSLIPDFLIPATEIPSFTSFCACRIHEMKIKIEIQCNDESFTATFTTKRSVLLPQDFQSPFKQIKNEEHGDSKSGKQDDSYADAIPGQDDAPPSFGMATSNEETLPGYSRDGTY